MVRTLRLSLVMAALLAAFVAAPASAQVILTGGVGVGDFTETGRFNFRTEVSGGYAIELTEDFSLVPAIAVRGNWDFDRDRPYFDHFDLMARVHATYGVKTTNGIDLQVAAYVEAGPTYGVLYTPRFLVIPEMTRDELRFNFGFGVEGRAMVSSSLGFFVRPLAFNFIDDGSRFTPQYSFLLGVILGF